MAADFSVAAMRPICVILLSEQFRLSINSRGGTSHELSRRAPLLQIFHAIYERKMSSLNA
jgi:hypothetical protein